MKSIRYLFRLTCDSWILCLRTSGSELGWALVFELGFSVGMVLGEPVEYILGYSINMLLVLALDNYFVTRDRYLVWFLLGLLVGLVIGIREGSLVYLLLGLPIKFSSEYPNPGLTGIICGMSLVDTLGLLFDSICNINWCGPWIGNWQFLWHFSSFPYLIFSWLGTWYNTLMNPTTLMSRSRWSASKPTEAES